MTLEQIDLIMQRANVSYNEAKIALEQCNGDTLEALLYLEKNQKIKSSSASNSEKVNSFINKLNATTFIMKKKERIYIDVPLSVALIGGILCFPLSIIALALSLIFGIKVDIHGENEVAEKINSSIDFLKK